MSRGRAVAHQLFSTKQLVPGHVVGTLILVLGTIGVAKLFMAKWEAAEEEHRRQARPSAPFLLPPAAIAAASGVIGVNGRGHYGRKFV